MEFPVQFRDRKRAYFMHALEAMIFSERVESIGKYGDCCCYPLRNCTGWVVVW